MGKTYENKVLIGDCLKSLKKIPDDSVDSCVTDPPYGLSKEPNIEEVLTKWIAGESYTHKFKGFMGKDWDSFVPSPEVWKEVYRVLKPGSYALIFAGTRTQDLMTISLRLAGFEVRDVIEYLYLTGFPKNHDISKAIDKNAPETKDAKKWEGWGTALKPSHEPIILVRKPMSEDTIAGNVLKHSTGGLNIDGSRIGEGTIKTHNAPKGTFAGGEWERGSEKIYKEHEGRYPANSITRNHDQFYTPYFNITPKEISKKASKKDRNSDYLGESIEGEIKQVSHDGRKAFNETPHQRHKNVQVNNHPTVKSIPLMEWLVKLITPPGGVVLDPYAGSGSTLVAAKKNGFNYIGCEMSSEYAAIIHKRLHTKRKYTLVRAKMGANV